jgi:hypothetical protein
VGERYPPVFLFSIGFRLLVLRSTVMMESQLPSLAHVKRADGSSKDIACIKDNMRIAYVGLAGFCFFLCSSSDRATEGRST